ncbi:DUF5317 domain-containing protein [Sporosalibacterium faouarense]|uniref:DUF5317 domain-containing protein n=1 Tax=Sporosalibacterium faouarense TaxID=516123 RepID=UPI00141C8C9B|nr:DUF5317 domain-containing protein [Sporosalibacterium faouarense]MTI49742.1 hypothetical protein [Bacillota bacterium]
MIIESVASSLVVGKARGGKFKLIGELELKKYYLFIIGFGIEFLSVFLNTKNLGFMNQILDKYFIIIHTISYLLIFIGLIFNFNKKSMIFVFIGTLLNYIVIISNGGQMPVSGSGLSYLGLKDTLNALKNHAIITHTLVNENTRLFFLGDVIPTPKFYPFSKMISIGDIFLGIGVFILIQNGMLKKARD